MQREKDQEKTWVKQLRRGDSAGLDELFRRYYPELCRVAVRILRREAVAEDVVQEFFLSLWEKRNVLPEIESVGPYLRRGVRNRSLNYIRDQRLLTTDDGEMPEMPTNHDVTSAKLELEELQQRVDRAINALPERCRLVYVLRQFEEMSYREISAELGIAEKTVENQMNRAYKFLRQYLSAVLLFLWIVVP